MALLMPLPLTVSCFSKIQIGFTFLVPAHLGSPGKRAVKRVCVWGVADDGVKPQLFAKLSNIQTAGLAFGGTGLRSYRVRGVGGSCAEHLTVEYYTIIISLQSYLLS